MASKAPVNEFVFDGTSLEDLARDLRLTADKLIGEIDITLLEIGEELKEAAKKLVESHSKNVADTIRVVPGKGFVSVVAGDDATPIAALWELGNKGTHDSGRVTGVFFRHPVFGDTTNWVQQRRFPFLRPALDADRKNITKLMNETWDRVLRPYHMEPEG